MLWNHTTSAKPLQYFKQVTGVSSKKASFNVAQQNHSSWALMVQSLGCVIVCGHSLGGPLAAELARRHPAAVVGLIVLGCRSYPQSEAQRARYKILGNEDG